MAFVIPPSISIRGKARFPERRTVCHQAPAGSRRLAHVLSRRAVILRTAALCQPVIAMAVKSEEPRSAEKERRNAWWPPLALKKMFALVMETGMGDYELAIASRKRALFSKLMPNTRILDIGIGTGPNLVYLPNNVRCVGLDPNEYMQPYALRKASNLLFRNIGLEILEGNAENIPARDESFDTVICTLTLCSVGDPAQVLKEVQRVLKPGGLFLFIEHVQAKEIGLRMVQNILNPLQTFVADGCHLNRRTGDLIRQHGNEFSDVEIEEFKVDLGFGGEVISTQICGYAMKKSTTAEL